MSQTLAFVQMAPVAGVRGWNKTSVQIRWAVAPRDVDTRGVNPCSPSNAELLEAAKRSKPPQSWYDEDHDGLY